MSSSISMFAVLSSLFRSQFYSEAGYHYVAKKMEKWRNDEEMGTMTFGVDLESLYICLLCGWRMAGS